MPVGQPKSDGTWLCGHSILVGWMDVFGYVDVGFWLCGRWILVVLTLQCGCLDV